MATRNLPSRTKKTSLLFLSTADPFKSSKSVSQGSIVPNIFRNSKFGLKREGTAVASLWGTVGKKYGE